MIYQLTGIDYSFDYPISPQDLQQLFQETDWANNRNLNDIKKMLNGSSSVIGAWSNGELIGFARVITDNVFRALIDDVIIHPIKRSKGVGSNLIQKLIDRLTELKIEGFSYGATSRSVYFIKNLVLKLARVPPWI